MEFLIGQGGLCANASDRRLDILALQSVDDVGWRQLIVGQALRIDPDPHAVVGWGQQGDVTNALHAFQAIKQVDGDVVGKEELVVALGGGCKCNELQDGGGLFHDVHALGAHVLRQLGLRELHAVLYVDGVDVWVGADGKCDGQGVTAIVAAGRLHVEHVVDAYDAGFDRLRHCGLNHLCACTSVTGGDRHLRRDDGRELRDRYGAHRHEARDRDHEGYDDRQSRAADEKAGDHGSGLRCNLGDIDRLPGSDLLDALHHHEVTL